MTEQERSELYVLQQEFDWLLSTELPRAYLQLTQLIEALLCQFPANGDGALPKAEKFVLNASQHTTHDLVRGLVTVQGGAVTSADVKFKFNGPDGKRGGGGGGGNGSGNNAPHRTSLPPSHPWRLQQLQDAHNTLLQARDLLQYANLHRSKETAMQELSSLATKLSLARHTLLVPRRRTIDELLSQAASSALSPPLPQDTALSFYLQGHKLVLAVYQLLPSAAASPSGVRLETVAAEAAVPWLSAVLAGLTTATTVAAAVRDKVAVFAQYKDLQTDANSVSSVSV